MKRLFAFFNLVLLSINFSLAADLDLRNVVIQEKLELPDVVEGSLNLSGLYSLKDIILPKEVKGDLFLSSLFVADTVFFLCSDQAKYLNGSEIHVNGGQHV